MHGEAPAPTATTRPAARLDRLGYVLAAVTAAFGAIALIGGWELSLRGNAVIVVVAIVAFVGGFGLLLVFRDRSTPRRLQRAGSVASLMLLAISLAGFMLLIGRSALVDSRPVVTASATGDGPLTVAGTVSADGLGPTEHVAVKVVDADAVPFQALAGPEPDTGRASIPFKVRLNGRPDRDITIVAWLVDRVTTEPTCVGPAPDARLVTCVRLALHSPATVAPNLTLIPYLTPGARTVTVSVTGVVGPDEGIQVNLWDRDALLQSFFARPGPDGKVDSSAAVPIHDDRAVLCAVADIVSQPEPRTVPSPCLAKTFVQMIIPPVGGPSPSAPGPGASTAP